MNFSINPFTEDLAVDLGTVHTFIYGRGRGMVVNEPSLVAIDKVSDEVIAVGNEALEMLGRSPEDVVVVYPMQDGVVADSELTQTMLKKFVRKARGGRARIGFASRFAIIKEIPLLLHPAPAMVLLFRSGNRLAFTGLATFNLLARQSLPLPALLNRQR